MLQIVRLNPKLCNETKAFFGRIRDNKYFHPHPFTDDEALARCSYAGSDIYAVCTDVDILAYGMVRGIEKWKTPCLGVCVGLEYRKQGLGELLVGYLHAAAKLKGIKKLRLHVHPENLNALLLYGKTGYRFSGGKHNGELVGYKTL